MSAIEKELLDVTKMKPKKGEDQQAYLHRLIGVVQDLKDEEWEALSNEAQTWVNDGAEAIKKNGNEAEIEPFPDAEEPADEESAQDDSTTETESEQEESVDTKSKAKAKPAAKSAAKPKAAAAKPAEKAKEKKPAAGPKATGIKVQIKKMVLKKPTISVDEIEERLGKDGTKPSRLTISAIRSEFRHSLFVLRDAGALSESIEL